MALPKPPVISFANLPDEELINDFINSPLTTAKSLLRQPDQKQRFWQLLEKYPNNQQLSKAYHKVEQILGVIPTFHPQTQTQPAAAQTPPPTRTAQQIVQPAAPSATPAPKNGLTKETAPEVEKWLNGVKGYVYDAFAKESPSVHRAAAYSHAFTNQILSSLAMYRGGLAKFYFDEGVWEMIFSALGPIGDAMRHGYEKDMQRKMSWMKNPLNPNAIYYYLNSLPNQAAFKLLYLPGKKVFGILARGGAPLISRVTYTNQQTGKVHQDFVFTPLLRATQFSQKAADSLDRLSGITSDSFSPTRDKKSPWDLYLTGKNASFSNYLEQYKLAKKQFLSSRIIGDQSTRHSAEIGLKQSRQDIKNLLNSYDGGVVQAIFGKLLGNTARRLRHTHRDPISFLFALIGGLVWDLSAGLALNTLRYGINQIINNIPGLNTLRAQAIEFFSSNRYLTTARIGGASVSSFVKGVFSPTTASSIYLGSSWGGFLSDVISKFNPQLGAALRLPLQVGLGATWGGFGAFYTTALKMDGQLISQWLKNGEFVKGFGPGPLTTTASWLYQHPFARLPINGYVVGDLLSPLMQARYGWNPWFTKGVFAGADYLWQVKGAIGRLLTQDAWKIFGRTYATPYFRIFSLNNPYSPMSKFTLAGNRFLYSFRFGINTYIQTQPWLNNTIKFINNSLKSIKPYFQNVFNPGFFLGFNLIPLLTPTLGAWAYIAGPIAGSSAWLLGTRIAAAITGIPFGQFSAMFNPLAYTGFFIGQISGLFIFGFNVPLWYTMGWTIGLPALGIGLQSLAWSLGYSSATYLLGSVISSITGGLISSLAATTAMASAIAAWATFMSVATILGLTIFSLFVITSALWVPMQALHNATPTSNYFNIQTNAVCPPNSSTCRFCSNFSVSQPLLNQNSYLEHQFDFANTNLTVDLTDPKQTITVFRNATPLQYNPNYGPNITPPTDFTTNFGVLLPLSEPFFVGGQQPGGELLTSYLSSRYALKASLFDQIKEHSELNSIIAPVLDILQKIAQDRLPENNTDYYLDELEATTKILQKQASSLTNFPEHFTILSQTDLQGNLNYYLTNNPLNEPVNACAVDDQRCQRHFQAMQGIYNSWASPFNQLLYYVNNPSEDNQAAVEALVTNLSQQAVMQQNIYNKLNTLLPIFPVCNPNLEGQCQIVYQGLILLTDTNIYNFSNLPEARDILTWYFGDIFNNTQYYYFPQGSNYQVCAEADYCSPSLFPDGCSTDPQTVCSIIHAQQGNWWYASATEFAKQCTTITPQ